MRFTVGTFNVNLKVLLNRLGYHEHIERGSNQISYIRRLGGGYYPRFHLYVNKREENFEFNLHLDEKKPSYAGTPRHAGQYEGELVTEEARRIKYYLQSFG